MLDMCRAASICDRVKKHFAEKKRIQDTDQMKEKPSEAGDESGKTTKEPSFSIKAMRRKGQDPDPRDPKKVCIEQGIEPHPGPQPYQARVKKQMPRKEERKARPTKVNLFWQILASMVVLGRVQADLTTIEHRADFTRRPGGRQEIQRDSVSAP